MRLTREQLYKITGRKRPKLQAAWFKDYLGIDIPCDAEGPILTERSYEALIAKVLGVGPPSVETAPERRPVVHLRENKK